MKRTISVAACRRSAVAGCGLLLALAVAGVRPARGDYLGSWKLGDSLPIPLSLNEDADDDPTFEVYGTGSSFPITNGTLTAKTTGESGKPYLGTLTLGGSFAKGGAYSIHVSTTIDSVVRVKEHTFQVEAEVDANTVSPIVSADVTQFGGVDGLFVQGQPVVTGPAIISKTVASLQGPNTIRVDSAWMPTNDNELNGFVIAVLDEEDSRGPQVGIVEDYDGTNFDITTTIGVDFGWDDDTVVLILPPVDVIALSAIAQHVALALPDAAPDAAGGLPISDDGGLDLDAALAGHTPQTGDSYAIVNSGTHGNAALKTLIDDVPTLAELIDELDTAIISGSLTIQEFVQQAAPLLIAEGIATSYAAGRIWVDTNDGATGDTPFLNGTVSSPLLTIEQAFDIAENLGDTIKDFNIAHGSVITLSETSSDKNFIGNGWTLGLGNQDITGSHFSGVESVSGIGTGTTPVFDRCTFHDVTLPPTVIVNSSFAGTFTASGAGQFLIAGGVAAADGAEPSFDFSGVSGATHVDIRNWTGGIDIKVGDGVTVTLDSASAGTVTLSGDGGTGGATVNIRGHVESVVDNTTGPVTVNQDGRR